MELNSDALADTPYVSMKMGDEWRRCCLRMSSITLVTLLVISYDERPRRGEYIINTRELIT